MSLESCLPEALRGPTTTITPIAAGLSGAGVYRVESAGGTFVLKVDGDGPVLSGWRERFEVLRQASDAGLAPRVVHSDEPKRAVVSAFVADRSFPALFWNPATRDTALALLGRTLRQVHALPPPPAATKTAREILEVIWSRLDGAFALPGFAREAVERVRSETPPPLDRAKVLSHNDVNPTNLVFDGERLLLLDWDAAGLNDPFYDLAAVSVFLRMDTPTCEQLLSAYDGAPAAGLPARFLYNRRLVAAFCGTTFLHLARAAGHAGARGDETLESTRSLLDVYQGMRAGTFSVATPEGKWSFGLALLQYSVAL